LRSIYCHYKVVGLPIGWPVPGHGFRGVKMCPQDCVFEYLRFFAVLRFSKSDYWWFLLFYRDHRMGALQITLQFLCWWLLIKVQLPVSFLPFFSSEVKGFLQFGFYCFGVSKYCQNRRVCSCFFTGSDYILHHNHPIPKLDFRI
jgi:hypothetical protein